MPKRSCGAPRRQDHALIATDGVFSMDGDLAPLAALSALAQRFDAWLLADDAHGLGVVGGGRGSRFANGPVDVPLQMGTLSKAAGAYGGYLCASRAVIDLMRTRARTFIYSTGLPPPVIAAAIAALDMIEREPDLRRRAVAQGAVVHARAQFAGGAERDRAADRRRDRCGACGVAKCWRTRAFWWSPSGRPRCRAGTARLRFAFTAQHPDADIERLADIVRRRVLERYSVTAIFITATGTDVGKTYVAASLIRHLRQMGRLVDAIKPVVSGFDPAQAVASDPGMLLDALGLPVTKDNIGRISPWRYRAPLSPDLAAAWKAAHRRRSGDRLLPERDRG